jgi:hypothetical protein
MPSAQGAKRPDIRGAFMRIGLSHRFHRCLLAGALFPLCLAGAAASQAQEPDSSLNSSENRNALPRTVVRDVAGRYNEPAALRATGSLEIPPSQSVNGNLAVLNGPLTLAGHVGGHVIVINGDVILRRGAHIGGDLVVVGGIIEGRDRALIDGDVEWHRQVMHYHLDGEQLVPERPSEAAEGDVGWIRRWRRRYESSTSRLDVNTGGYNRVEGLSILLGPTLRQRFDWGHVSVDAYGILRTSDRLKWTSQNLGYDVTAETQLGRRTGVAIGGHLFDIVDAAEPWQLRDNENSLAAFFLHRDFRDYFSRHGGDGYVSLRNGADASLTFSYGAERWGSRDAVDPFSLFRNDVEWRSNPRLDEGLFRIGTATLEVDTRNDHENPWTGWYITAALEHGSSDSVRLAPASELARTETGVLPVSYTRGLIDARRYNRVAPDAQLNFRVVLGGWLAGDPLPLQRRFSLGGPGTLPGYDFRGPPLPTDLLNCSNGTVPAGYPAQCERLALGQVEYRGDIHIRVGGRSDWSFDDRWWDFSFNRTVQWVVFGDMGRGWLVGPTREGGLQYRSGEFPSLATFRTDVGLGLDLGFLGLYVAKSVSDSDESPNFFVRLRHRF